MPRPQPPQVKIGQSIAVRLNGLADTALRNRIGQHVEQDRSCVADYRCSLCLGGILFVRVDNAVAVSSSMTSAVRPLTAPRMDPTSIS